MDVSTTDGKLTDLLNFGRVVKLFKDGENYSAVISGPAMPTHQNPEIVVHGSSLAELVTKAHEVKDTEAVIKAKLDGSPLPTNAPPVLDLKD